MSAPTDNSANGNGKAAGLSGQARLSGEDRRRRKRAKITGKVHVRLGNAVDSFEEVCTSVDVSRDGLLFSTTYVGYLKGQRLSVIFPYTPEPGAMNQAMPAEIVRVQEQRGNKFAVAVHFLSAKTAAKGMSSGSVYALPAALQNRPASAPAAAPPIAPSASWQSVILIVEPDVESAETMRALIEKDGYTVIVAPTAKQALEVMRTTVPSAFLADSEGRDGDIPGSELCLAIKQNMRLRNVPVILFTRQEVPADYSESRHMGAVMFLSKPIQPERLQQLIRLVAPQPANNTAYGTRVVGTVERTI